MAVAGIDFNSTSSIDIVLLNDEGPGATWCPLGYGAIDDPFAAAARAREIFPTRSWWEEHGVWLVGVEDPMSRWPHVAKALGVVAGAIRVLLPPDLCVVPTQPKEWKRVAVGDANASKEQVAAWAAAELPVAADWPLDATDAYAIARAVRELNERAIRRGAA